jgi:uncharacterized protein YjbI with pentapeptide repeats
MDTRTIRDRTILLPGGENDLDPTDIVPRDGVVVADRLIGGHTLERANLTKLTITRTLMVNADLSSARLTDTRWDRCVLRGCTLIGANITNGTFKNVIFENCRLDYATFDQVHTAGPTAFVGCALTETTFTRCGLTSMTFDGCKLAATEFDSTDLRGADLRGNDLSTLIGIGSLRGAVIGHEQLPGLTEALMRDLDLIVKPI